MSQSSNQALAQRLSDLYQTFETEGEGALVRLSELYDPAMVFRDPLQTLHGREAFIAMNRRVMKRARELSFDITDAVGGNDSIFLAWKMSYQPSMGPTMIFDGATRARVVQGRIVAHTDYWDLLSTMAHSLPIARQLYARLAPHLG